MPKLNKVPLISSTDFLVFAVERAGDCGQDKDVGRGYVSPLRKHGTLRALPILQGTHHSPVMLGDFPSLPAPLLECSSAKVARHKRGSLYSFLSFSLVVSS